MGEKLKKIFNNKTFMFIFGGLLFSTVSVYAVTYFPSNQVTYDNSSSKLSSTNVQGAIDELYNTCSKVASSGKYLYYAITDYNVDDELPYSGILYRCNIDGSNCTEIKSVFTLEHINSVYATSDYLYYAITNYNGGYKLPYSGILYRCNIDGSNCTEIKSVSSLKHINSVYATSDYLYYAITNYNGGYKLPYSGILYRCNIDGSNCTEIKSVSSLEHINAIG